MSDGTASLTELSQIGLGIVHILPSRPSQGALLMCTYP